MNRFADKPIVVPIDDSVSWLLGGFALKLVSSS